MDVFYQHSCFANYDEACHVLNVDEAGKVIMITLYDHRIPLQERTKLKKKDLWQEVSNCIREAYSPVDAEKRWQYLRDCYTKARRNFKKIQSTEKRSGAAGTSINKPSFRYYDAMSFLNDTLEYKETCTSLRLSNKRDTARVTNLPSPSCSSTNDGNDDYTDLENRPPSSVSELSATTSSSQKRRRSNNTDEIDRALLEALNTNVQPSPIDGFMLRLAEGMRRLPYRERSNLELEFLMKLRETEERLGLLDNI
ncbi:histone H3 [Lasius niger]|uniref:Histone H3 n=1 Tax=Lasius niger TaxID=67767 RepID=A0A0J7KTP9_LASNI|nr:histone H3 [Lasius niger]